MGVSVGSSIPNYKRQINARRMKHIENSNSIAEATKMGAWDSFVDYFFSGYKKKACAALFVLLKPQQTNTVEEVAAKVKAFQKLKQLTDPRHHSEFKFTLTPVVEAQNYKLTFSIQGFGQLGTTATLVYPSKQSQHVQDINQYQLTQSASNLMQLQQAMVELELGQFDIDDGFCKWNLELKKMQTRAQFEALLASTKLDDHFKFNVEALEDMLAEAEHTSLTPQLVNLWESIPLLDLNNTPSYTKPTDEHSFHHVESTQKHFESIPHTQAEVPSRANSGCDETEDDDSPCLPPHRYTEEQAGKIILKKYKAYKERRNLKQKEALDANRPDTFIQMKTEPRSDGTETTYLVDPRNVLPPIKKLLPPAIEKETDIQGTTKKTRCRR